MLQTLSERIQLCYERAAEAKQHAKEMSDPKTKADFSNIEKRWLLLARSYQLSDSLKDFIHPIPQRPDPVSKNVTGHGEPPLRNWEEDLQTATSGK